MSRSEQAEATRAAILASARKSFAAFGYDGAGLRKIAEDAGVTAMMVQRYFGSKEGLFGEVVSDTMRDPVVFSQTNLAASDLAQVFAEALVGLTEKNAPILDSFLILWRSSSSPVAAAIARDRIAKAHQATAEAVADGPNGPQRAAIFLSLVAGFQLMRQMLRLSPLVDGEPQALVELLASVFTLILKPPTA